MNTRTSNRQDLSRSSRKPYATAELKPGCKFLEKPKQWPAREGPGIVFTKTQGPRCDSQPPGLRA